MAMKENDWILDGIVNPDKNLDDFKLVFNGFYKFLESYYFQTYIHDKSEKTINEIKRFMRNKKFSQIY